MGDKAYSSAADRAYLRRRGIKAVIPVKEDQKANRPKRGSRGGRQPAFDPARYKERNTVERCFNKLRQFRAVATRTTNASASTRAPSIWPPSGSGSATRHMICKTRPILPASPSLARLAVPGGQGDGLVQWHGTASLVELVEQFCTELLAGHGPAAVA
jgi:transposase